MKAKELMSRAIVFAQPDMPVAALAEMIAARGISAVPIVEEDGTPVGIVTEGDLIRRLADEPPGPMRWFFGLFGSSQSMVERYVKAHGAVAADVMTRTLVTVGEDAPAEEVARAMEKHHVRRVLVLRDGKLTGLVSRADLLRALLRPAQAPAAARDDRAILQGVLDAMRAQPWTDTYWVYPGVHDGLVTLYGFARTPAMRIALKLLVKEVPGVKDVKDAMEDMPLLAQFSA
ncbi:MAG: CBS domain-containing protein [Pseudomonadota bacterium]